SGGLTTGQDIQTNVLNNRASQAPTSAYMRMLTQLQAQGGNTQLTPIQRNLLTQARMLDLKNAQKKASETTEKPAPGTPGTPGNTSINGGRNAGAFGTSNVPMNTGVVPAAPGLSNGGAIAPSQNAPSTQRATNIVVPSFAQEEADKPTAAILAKAEQLMKQGKFSSALEQYDQVEQTSPNNPFALLGRANAELGATSYGLAEQHLRRAFMGDQALMMARYDLNSFLGAERLEYLIKDLKDIAQANQNEPRPVFLLAYICYNTGKDRAAAQYLALAQKRSGKPDPFYKLLQQRWDLPSISDSNSDLNK
ncbi:MAG: hypothetical protein JO353_04820, partial [Phycisphaerae bacterium]|nr:hypothetical protein [Phycisphaerae bacterium]